MVSLSSRDADLCRPDSLLPFSDKKYTHIYHCAAWIQGGDFSLHHAGEQWLINQQINTTVLRWWAQEQPQARLISIGSSGAYAEGTDLHEGLYLVGEPVSGLYAYGMTKRMLHIGQISLAQQYDLKFLTVVPSTVYGPHYPVGAKRRHFIYDLAAKILSHKHFGEDIVLWGDGYQKRELTYIDDFINDLFLIEQKTENDIINIGAGTQHTIRTFSEILCEMIGVDPDIIQYDVNRYTGAREKYLNIQKERGILGDLVRTPLHEGLHAMLDSFTPLFLAYEHHRRKHIPVIL